MNPLRPGSYTIVDLLASPAYKLSDNTATSDQFQLKAQKTPLTYISIRWSEGSSGQACSGAAQWKWQLALDAIHRRVCTLLQQLPRVMPSSAGAQQLCKAHDAPIAQPGAHGHQWALAAQQQPSRARESYPSFAGGVTCIDEISVD